MIDSKYIWKKTSIEKEKAEKLANELNIPLKFATIILKRNITTAAQFDKFIHPENYTGYDPFLFAEMSCAVERIKKAITNKEKILIYGDYDADGVTSVAVLWCALDSLGAHVDFYIPNRFTEGYGPNEKAFQDAKEKGIDLIITVDNGIAALEVMKFAKSIQLDVIITDHHEPREIMPEAVAVIHPRHPKSQYPFLDLAGVGVSYKLACALLGREPTELLDLVAVGTVADLVPLTDENRLFVQQGLLKMQTNPNLGVSCLIKSAGVKIEESTAETIGFIIAPRLNASGRLGSASKAVELLLAKKLEDAQSLATEMEKANTERKSIVQTITKEAIDLVEALPKLPSFIILKKEGWNHGVLGIVASKLVEKYRRPALLFAVDPATKIAKGSGRSIENFHLYKALAKNKEMMITFGGHPSAAGVTISLKQFAKFKQNLNEQADIYHFDTMKNELLVEEVLTVSDVSLEIVQMIEKMAPFGIGNPKPLFEFTNVHFSGTKRIGANKTHFKTLLTSKGESSTLDVVGFGKGDLMEQIARHAEINVVGELSINEWNGIRKPQLQLIDLKIDHWQLFDVRGQSEWRWLQENNHSERIFICFKDNTNANLKISEKQIVFYERDLDKLSCIKELVFVDMPESSFHVKQILQITKPERIYIHFDAIEANSFKALPNRDAFKKLYALIKKYQPFLLEKYQPILTKQFGWSLEEVHFMANVFFELEFTTVKNGAIHLNQVAQKRSLLDSKLYKDRENQLIIQQKLLYANYNDLYKWIKQIIESK